MRLRTAAAGPDLFPLFLHTIWALPWCTGKKKRMLLLMTVNRSARASADGAGCVRVWR